MSLLASELEKQSPSRPRRGSSGSSGSDSSDSSIFSRLLPQTDATLLKHRPSLTPLTRSAIRSLRTSLLPTWLPLNPLQSSPSQQLSSTSWLDGLRGTAALLVFAFHYVYAFYATAEYGYGSGSANHYVFQLPILRVWLSGPSMVSTFFVVSGYALSYKSIGLIRRKQYSSVLTTLSSSTFRRAVRLFLPAWVSLSFIAIFIKMGLFNWSIKHASKESGWFEGWREDNPPGNPTISDVVKCCLRMVNPWSWQDVWLTYDLHLWTIPVEFRCSLVVFLCLLGLSRVRSMVRMSVLAGLGGTALVYASRWDVAGFLFGVVICEVNYIHSTRTTTSLPILSAPTTPKKRTLKTVAVFAAFLLSLFLCSIPRMDPQKTPLYATLYNHIPRTVSSKDRFYPTIGSTLLVLSISSSSLLKRPFESRFAQYLGKISFSMYLVHGAVCRSVGYRVVIYTWQVVGRGTWLGKTTGVVVGAVFVGGVVFWLADVFWRVVDVRSVTVARWVEAKCLDTESEEEPKA